MCPNRSDRMLQMFSVFRLFLSRILMRGGKDMIPVYCTLIIKGALTFAQVPISSQPAVEAMLLILGYGTDGKPLSTP